MSHSGASGTFILRFLDEPFTVIVLTNLDSPSGGRHHAQIARMIAGAIRPELIPPFMLSPATDPSPALTQTVTTLLSDVAANRELTGASDAFKRTWQASPGRRAVARNTLRSVAAVEYVGSDDVAGKPLWDAEPLARLVYYRVSGGSQPIFITVGVTADARIARLDLPFVAAQ